MADTNLKKSDQKLNKISIIDYYENGELDKVNFLMHQFFIGAIKPDLYDLLELLSMTSDTMLIKEITMILTMFQPSFIRDLITIYRAEEYVLIKEILLNVIISQINIVNLPLLIEQYLKNEKYRYRIKAKLLEEEETTFLALTNYLEMIRSELTSEDLEWAKELLSEIDPKYYYQYASALTNMLIADLFYKIDPDKFTKK